MFGMVLFGIPAALIANAKGFAPFRWLLAFGVVGFVVVLCLPSARKRGLSPDEAASRASRGNTTGMWLCGLNLATVGVWLMLWLARLLLSVS